MKAWGHVCRLASRCDLLQSGEEFYKFKPKATGVYYQWNVPSSLNGMKYANLASAFNCSVAWLSCGRLMCLAACMSFFLSAAVCFVHRQELENSKLFSRCWRVFYSKESKVS